MSGHGTDWLAPGAHAAAPGVHHMPLPLPTDGLRAVGVYAIADGDALTLADAGRALAQARDQLSAALGGPPAHGPVAGSVHDRLGELLARHDARLDATEAAIAAAAGTAYQAASAVARTRRGRTPGELDPFNQMLAVLETVAHLDLLALQGRVRKERAGGVIGYTRA